MNQPVVLRFRFDRFELAKLSFTAFVLSYPTKNDFWSLVQHCRQSTTGAIRDHRGPVTVWDGTNWYDVVCGPVSAFWRQRYAMQDTDQFSFHTEPAVELLNRLIDTGDPKQYSAESLE
jgi:hypothetical protein